jgi:hypothetical protein
LLEELEGGGDRRSRSAVDNFLADIRMTLADGLEDGPKLSVIEGLEEAWERQRATGHLSR